MYTEHFRVGNCKVFNFGTQERDIRLWSGMESPVELLLTLFSPLTTKKQRKKTQTLSGMSVTVIKRGAKYPKENLIMKKSSEILCNMRKYTFKR